MPIRTPFQGDFLVRVAPRAEALAEALGCSLVRFQIWVTPLCQNWVTAPREKIHWVCQRKGNSFGREKGMIEKYGRDRQKLRGLCLGKRKALGVNGRGS